MSELALHIVILAAGKGSRMLSDKPKVLHTLAGKPLLGHVIDAAKTLSPAGIHIVVGHGREQIQTHFSEYGDELNWVVQQEQLGTGHAVQQALPNIDRDSNILILSGDVPLINSDTLTELVGRLDAAPLAILTAHVENPHGLGRILRDGENSVIEIVEEKDATLEKKQIKEINSGIIAARAGLLIECLEQVSDDNAQGEYYLTDVIGLAANKGNLVASQMAAHESEVVGINSREQLADAERAYQIQQAGQLMRSGVTLRDPARIDIRGNVSIGADTEIDINVVISGDCVIGKNCQIGPNCVINSSTLAEGVQVHANSVIEQATIGESANIGPFARIRPGTEMGTGARIGNFVETKNAKLGTGVKINHLSYVGDAKVGRDTNVGAGVITCNYDGANKHRTEIGKNVFVGSDSQLVAPVKIADGATVGAGSTITSDVSENELAISRGKQRQITNWQRPSKASKSD